MPKTLSASRYFCVMFPCSKTSRVQGGPSRHVRGVSCRERVLLLIFPVSPVVGRGRALWAHFAVKNVPNFGSCDSTGADEQNMLKARLKDYKCTPTMIFCHKGRAQFLSPSEKRPRALVAEEMQGWGCTQFLCVVS